MSGLIAPSAPATAGELRELVVPVHRADGQRGVRGGWLADHTGPVLPAATTNNAPVCAVRRLAASDIGSVPSVWPPPPTLMLTTSAPLVAAHSMPAMILGLVAPAGLADDLSVEQLGIRRDAPVPRRRCR